jgi:hypothetical protein
VTSKFPNSAAKFYILKGNMHEAPAELQIAKFSAIRTGSKLYGLIGLDKEKGDIVSQSKKKLET